MSVWVRYWLTAAERFLNPPEVREQARYGGDPSP